MPDSLSCSHLFSVASSLASDRVPPLPLSSCDVCSAAPAVWSSLSAHPPLSLAHVASSVDASTCQVCWLAADCRREKASLGCRFRSSLVSFPCPAFCLSLLSFSSFYVSCLLPPSACSSLPRSCLLPVNGPRFLFCFCFLSSLVSRLSFLHTSFCSFLLLFLHPPRRSSL